jgi:hypothetical protein
MKYLRISLIGALFMTLLSSAAFAQTAGGTSPGAGSTPGTSTTGNATPGTVTPGIGDTVLPLPSTTPTQRATTGITENQQMLDRPQDQPSTIQSDFASPPPSDMPAGATVTNSRQGSGGTATGRPSGVRDHSDTSNRQTDVIGPGQLSYPTALERQLPKTP